MTGHHRLICIEGCADELWSRLCAVLYCSILSLSCSVLVSLWLWTLLEIVFIKLWRIIVSIVSLIRNDNDGQYKWYLSGWLSVWKFWRKLYIYFSFWQVSRDVLAAKKNKLFKMIEKKTTTTKKNKQTKKQTRPTTSNCSFRPNMIVFCFYNITWQGDVATIIT